MGFPSKEELPIDDFDGLMKESCILKEFAETAR